VEFTLKERLTFEGLDRWGGNFSSTTVVKYYSSPLELCPPLYQCQVKCSCKLESICMLIELDSG